jgi:glycosyltransferase involved in cell wall biosynthesis
VCSSDLTDSPVDVDGVRVRYFRTVDYVKRWLPFVPYLSKSLGVLYTPAMAAALDRAVPGMDLVHTHLPFIYSTYAAARAAKKFNKPLFYHQRGVFDPERLKFRGFKKRLYISAVELPILRNATTLIALTDAEEKSYRALGVRTPCRVIPNGIDVALYRAEPRAGFDARWKIRPGSRVMLFLSRVHPIKGADKLLEGFMSVAARFPEAVLVLAGPDEWGVEAKYRESVRKKGLEGRVVFPGMVEGEEKLDLLARADLFCLPSAGEGFSMAVLEALASATPVLLSPGCHFPEVESAGAGRIAPAEPAAIAAALAEMLGRPEKLSHMGKAGRQFVSRDYTWDAIAGKLVDAYEEGIRRHKGMAEARA